MQGITVDEKLADSAPPDEAKGGVVERTREPIHDIELSKRYHRKVFGETMTFGLLAMLIAGLIAGMVYIGIVYIDILFSIDFANLSMRNLNEFFTLCVLLFIAGLNAHIIHQITSFIRRRLEVMGLLRELCDSMQSGDERIWRLRPQLWSEVHAEVIEEEGYFLSLRNAIEMAYKGLIAVQMQLVAIIQAAQEKRDLHPFIRVLGEELNMVKGRVEALRYPYFRDAGYSVGIRFYALFREEVNEMLKEITRLMNQFENMAMVEEQRKLEQEKSRRMELDRQHKLNEFSLESHLDIFIRRIDELNPQRLRGKNHTRFLGLYNALKNKFSAAGLMPPERLGRIQGDVDRINQIEDLIAFYEEKIRMVKNDAVDLTERRDKARYWSQLRDQHIAELRQKGVKIFAEGVAEAEKKGTAAAATPETAK